MSKPNVTAVVRTETVIVCSMVDLRSAVDKRLLELKESNNDAAKRAGTSGATWSRTIAADVITEGQLVMLANGLNLVVDELVRRCAS